MMNVAAQPGFGLPAKVDFALQYLNFAQRISEGQCSFDGASACSGRELSKKEQRVYDAALQSLLEFFNETEGGYINSIKNPPDDGQKELQPK